MSRAEARASRAKSWIRLTLAQPKPSTPDVLEGLTHA